MYSEDQIIEMALDILVKRIKAHEMTANSPAAVKNYLRIKLASLEHEVFGVLFVDVKHRLIEDSVMFTGTIDQAAVYPREVAKKALKVNAAAIVMYHNHPSGNSTPSDADKRLTENMVQALQLIDVKVLDHIVVSTAETTSFAEIGLI